MPRKPLIIRIDPGLWEELNRWAAEDLRSVNGQIEFLLRRALAAAGRLPGERVRRPGPEKGRP